MLRIFGIGKDDMKKKLGNVAETLWVSSTGNEKEDKADGKTDEHSGN